MGWRLGIVVFLVTFSCEIVLVQCLYYGTRYNYMRYQRPSYQQPEVMYGWDKVKNPRYKAYQYGFPIGTTSASVCPSQLFPGRDSPIRMAMKKSRAPQPKWEELYKLVETLTEEYKKNGDLKWKPKFTQDDIIVCVIYVRCEVKKGQHNVCPSPCKRSPCADVDHTSSSKCTKLNYGLFVNNFRCACQTTYSWSLGTSECTRVDLCKHRELYPCNRKNTELCLSKRYGGGFECQCKMEYMGVECNEPRNACVDNYDKEKPKGADACGTNGKCEPIKGSNIYGCTCANGYTVLQLCCSTTLCDPDDIKNGWPDCYSKKDLCADTLCINGFCRVSTSGSIVKCVCDEGFAGKDCSTKLPHWNSWGLWESCLPKCGDTRKRKRIRTCSTNENQCTGEREDFQKCIRKICLVDGSWMDWTPWTSCSVNCGGGEQAQTRECFYDTPYGEDGWGRPCPGTASQTRSCNTDMCQPGTLKLPEGPDAEWVSEEANRMANTRSDCWKSWETWSKCHSDCGPGEKIRNRECSLGPGKCQGLPFEVLSCEAPCPPGKFPYDHWSSWSMCTASSKGCVRTRPCPMGKDKCGGAEKETAPCVQGLCDAKDTSSLTSITKYMGLKEAAAFAQTRNAVGIKDGLYIQSVLKENILLEANDNVSPVCGGGIQAGGSQSISSLGDINNILKNSKDMTSVLAGAVLLLIIACSSIGLFIWQRNQKKKKRDKKRRKKKKKKRKKESLAADAENEGSDIELLNEDVEGLGSHTQSQLSNFL